MKPARSETRPKANVNNKSRPCKVQHRKPLSAVEWGSSIGSDAIATSNYAAVSGPVKKSVSNASNRSRTDSGQLLQPSSIRIDRAVSDSAFKGRAGRRNDVSTGCFFVVVCSLADSMLCITKRFQIIGTITISLTLERSLPDVDVLLCYGR